MIKLLQSNRTAGVIGAMLYLLMTAWLWHPPNQPSAPGGGHRLSQRATPSWNFQNAEMDLLIEELKKEKEALKKRQTQLNELSDRLQAERLEINQVTQMMHHLQGQFDSNVVHVVEEENANLKKLARTYAGMTPEAAALVFKQMDESTLLKILALMRDSEAAPIFEVMAKQSDAEAKRVANLSERLRLALPNPKDTKRNL